MTGEYLKCCFIARYAFVLNTPQTESHSQETKKKMRLNKMYPKAVNASDFSSFRRTTY